MDSGIVTDDVHDFGMPANKLEIPEPSSKPLDDSCLSRLEVPTFQATQQDDSQEIVTSNGEATFIIRLKETIARLQREVIEQADQKWSFADKFKKAKEEISKLQSELNRANEKLRMQESQGAEMKRYTQKLENNIHELERAMREAECQYKKVQLEKETLMRQINEEKKQNGIEIANLKMKISDLERRKDLCEDSDLKAQLLELKLEKSKESEKLHKKECEVLEHKSEKERLHIAAELEGMLQIFKDARIQTERENFRRESAAKDAEIERLRKLHI